MKVLLTGATGYIGARLLIRLIEEGQRVVLLLRNPRRFNPPPNSEGKYEIVQGDVLDPLSLNNIPSDIEAAYFLIHSMSADAEEFDVKDRIAAQNFIEAIAKTQCKQVIYLSGIANDENLSKHLSSRLEVEHILKQARVPLTTLRAAIIIGAGSASFEIIRDLVEKLPVMIAPKWVNSKCEPISIVDVIDYLYKVLGHEKCIGESFDIGSSQVFTYKEMLLTFAKIRKLKRKIITVPILTPKLSSYWLFFITTVSLNLARSLVNSLKNNAVCKDHRIQKIFPKKLLTYEEAIQRAFQKIEDHEVISSWKDAWSGSNIPAHYKDYLQVPTHGCLSFKGTCEVPEDVTREELMEPLYHMGGPGGYYVNWAWKLRGLIDRLFGGVGLRRGRVSRSRPRPGDALDFWRVLVVDHQKVRLLLYAEMKSPGEAWLEFKLTEDEQKNRMMVVTATFRPTGLFGRLYWYSLLPIHIIIFKGLPRRVVREAQTIYKGQGRTS